MIIGFLAEDFHTEVLDYLFELHNSSEFNLILYNTNDRYNNLEIYKNKYNNLKIKDISYFVLDLTSGLFDKAYMVSYDNVIVPEMLTLYKSKLVFIAHNKRHVQLFSFLNMDFITLTPGLFVYDKNINYTLPICKGQEEELKLNSIKKTDTLLRHLNIGLIGTFNEENKDLDIIHYLLNASKEPYISITLYIFTNSKNDILKLLQEKYDNFIVYQNKTTNEVLDIIKNKNINFIGLFPHMESSFFKDQWSGSISFAYNNNLQLILPKQIAKLYKLRGHIDYVNKEDIVSEIINLSYVHNYDKKISEYIKFKSDVYERNKLITSIVLKNNNNSNEKNVLCTMTDYGALFVLKNDIIGQKLLTNNYYKKELLQMLDTSIKNMNSESTVIDIGSHIGSFSVGLLSENKNINVVSIEPQLYLAKLQKKTMLLNDFSDRVKIYHNAVGHKCIENIHMSKTLSTIDSLSQNEMAIIDYNDDKLRNYGGLQIGNDGEIVDMITIDSLKLDNVKMLKIDAEGAEKLVLYGARNTIAKYKPIIIYEYNWKNDDKLEKLLNVDKNVRNFDIVKFMESVGYKLSNMQRFEDNFIWIY